jgi:integrase/recombinase XerD
MKRFSRAAAETANDTATPTKKKSRKAPTRFKGTDHWLTREQVQAVCDAEPDPMYQTIFRLLAAHGLRVSEALSLRRTDVECGFLTIQRLKGSQKTTQKLLVDLSAYITAPTYRLFPVSRSSVFLHFRRAAAKVGLHPHLRHPHCLKHSTAHWLLNAGTPLQVASQWLGHSSLTSTAQYLNCSDQMASAAAQQVIGTL